MNCDCKYYKPVLSEGDETKAVVPTDVTWRNGLLIRATNWLGDTLMTLPASYKLSRLLPEPCGVFVMCPEPLVPLWQSAGWVTRTVPLTAKRAGPRAAAAVRGMKPGAAVVFPNSFGAALDVFGKGVPVRVGRRGRGRGPLLTHTLPKWDRPRGAQSAHQVNLYLELAAAFGPVEWDTTCPALQVDAAEQACERLGMRPERGPWLAVAPGAAYGPAKQWPAERFALLSRWWVETTGGAVAVVGTEKERRAAESVGKGCEGIVNLVGQTPLHDLMSVFATAAAVVANDSGAMHLAAAIGTPGVAIFGSTDPVATGPLGAPWIVLSSKTECSPCFRRECPHTAERRYACLFESTVEQAACGLQTILSEPESP